MTEADHPHTVIVANQKGGVGKTITSINVAGALHELGEDVLFLDLDPQGNASEGLGLIDAYESTEKNLKDALVPEDGTDLTELTREIIHRDVADGFDVIPSNLDMFTAERELTLSRGSEYRLQKLLKALPHDYDHIVIDTPPSLANLTDNAVIAADGLIVPALAESTSIRAFELLFDQMDSIEYEMDIDLPETYAVVANKVLNDGEATEMKEWMDAAFGDAVPVYEVRKRVELTRAWKNGVSIFSHSVDCEMDEVYLQIAEHVIGQQKQVVA